MRFDASQRHWALASAIILVLSAAVYHVYVYNSAFGAPWRQPAGFGLRSSWDSHSCSFAALLGARKRVQCGASAGRKPGCADICGLGLLSLPIILFHGGFHFGGTLTRVLMWLLIITVVSGLFGAALQHYIPRVMTTDVPFETIYDEIGNVRNLLLEEADRPWKRSAARSVSANHRRKKFSAPAASPPCAPWPQPQEALPSRPRRKFCCSPKKKALRFAASTSTKCARSSSGLLNADCCSPTRQSASRLFRIAHAAARARPRHVDDLQDICEEARQLQKQQRLHHWLHLWLLVHIPISLALIVLGAVHAVMALKY